MGVLLGLLLAASGVCAPAAAVCPMQVPHSCCRVTAPAPPAALNAPAMPLHAARPIAPLLPEPASRGDRRAFAAVRTDASPPALRVLRL
ncbi:MAG TPA: hypothetical protein VFP94_10155 [Terriglobales bacterium]|nr:hypothetical protein [Terriglobales bacterium]